MLPSLGQRIYQYRRANRLSQEDLADSLNVSRQSVSKWETDASIPDLDKLVALSELFGITLDELIKGETTESLQPLPTAPPPDESDVSHELPPPNESDRPPLPVTEPPQAPTPERFLSPRRIIGLALLGASLLFSFILLICNVEILMILIITSPIWLCGVICMTIRRHTGICCCWGVLIGIFSYLSYNAVFSFYNFNLITTVYGFFRFKEGPYAYWSGISPIGVAVQVFTSCLTVGLIVLTVIRFSKDSITVNRRTVVRALFAVGIFSVLYIGFQCLYMELYTLYFHSVTDKVQETYRHLYRITNIAAMIFNYMRPIAFTALISVILSFVREKWHRDNHNSP